ncbi:stage V sporulation protein S [Candidatus Acetothermia bacterium]|nr:stage V sporulation protein S [Candidatus Acetothermia bacterium]MBI3460351.1 stage V sporulation protein S [Candidatus Acetothermia bacterium]MBI3659936.1 stage V sporulation protein S [Candidatus Acetothermia bacterium]
MEVLKVAANSDAMAVAGAIAGALERAQAIEAHAVGAGAVNQTVKAIARRFTEKKGFELRIIPGFIDLEIDQQVKTGIRFIIER